MSHKIFRVIYSNCDEKFYDELHVTKNNEINT